MSLATRARAKLACDALMSEAEASVAIDRGRIRTVLWCDEPICRLQRGHRGEHSNRWRKPEPETWESR